MVPFTVHNQDVTTIAIYEWPFPMKLALKMNEADILMHLIESLLVQVFPWPWGYNIPKFLVESFTFFIMRSKSHMQIKTFVFIVKLASKFTWVWMSQLVSLQSRLSQNFHYLSNASLSWQYPLLEYWHTSDVLFFPISLFWDFLGGIFEAVVWNWTEQVFFLMKCTVH